LEKDFLIIIINFNGYEDTVECISSLVDAKISLSNILVIDNCSSDNSFPLLVRKFPDLIIIQTAINLGFAGANNIGIKYGIEQKFKYVILLNNDTTVEKESINILVNEMDNNPEITLGTGQIRYSSDKSKIWYGGGKLVGWRGLAIHIGMNKSFKNFSHTNDLINTEFISGCYLCIRVGNIYSLGLLNEKFFMYLEDVEYSARAIKTKINLGYFSKSIIYHKWRGGTKLKYHSLYYAVRNRKLLIDLVFPKSARYYFNIIIFLKLSFWFLCNKKLFRAANEGLKDYRQKYFGQIRSKLS
jgi:GT2 family glycosyltransferase